MTDKPAAQPEPSAAEKVLYEWTDDGMPVQIVADIDHVLFARTKDFKGANWRYIDEMSLIVRLAAKEQEMAVEIERLKAEIARLSQ